MDIKEEVQMSSSHFDVLIHAPNRLQICAMLASSAEVEFVVVRKQLDVSDSVLSKQIKILEEAGYLKLEKRAYLGRQRTWLSFTSRGLKAFKEHVNELKKIVG